MKRYLLHGVILAASFTLVAAPPASALLELVRSETAEVRQETNNGNGQVLNAVHDAELEQKRQEIRDRIAEKHAAVSEKLSGQRAEACEKKEAAINQMLIDKAAKAQELYDKFQNIQDRLTEFADTHHLDVDSAEALELIMIDKQQEAAALIDTVRFTTFDCANTSANNPGQVVRSLVEDKKQALTDYRDALRDYADAVREAAIAHDNSTDEHHRRGETTEESAQ